MIYVCVCGGGRVSEVKIIYYVVHFVTQQETGSHGNRPDARTKVLLPQIFQRIRCTLW